MDLKIEDFKLSAQLEGHSLDVRSVDATDNKIVSGSRDKTVRIWTRDADGKSYKDVVSLQDHTNYVSAVCVFNEGKWLATASNDKTICVYILGATQPFATLTDHTNTVCALSEGLAPCSLVSGSWDQTARVWNNLEVDSSSMELKGHEAAVWAVVTIKNTGKYATGSADKTILIFNEKGEKLVVLKGHTDCIRGLASLPDGSLLSCSNDASIRHWSDTYDCVREFHGHSNYIYSIALNPALGDVFVTGSEDSTIRLWSVSEGSLGQSLALPVQSVWSVACTPNGDIVTGSSDGQVRVFTKEASRFAPPEDIAAFEKAVNVREAEKSKELGGIKVNDLPGTESLRQPGTEGQTRLVRDAAGKIMCYQWTNGCWSCVGDVMGAAGGASGSGNMFEGQEYDFVFNVDIQDGVPPLKLPFNRSQDPWTVAQQFIHKHDLPQVYLEQVANFIIKNANLTSLPPVSGGQNFQDPFTGGGRYIPGSSQAGAPGVNVNFRERGVNSGMANLDPFTGGDSYSSGRSDRIVQRHIPFTTITTFDVFDASKIAAKLKEFNVQKPEIDNEAIDEVVKQISADKIDDVKFAAIGSMLMWPEDKLFPVLDVIRLVIRKEEACGLFDVHTTVLKYLTSTPPNQLMASRALSNLTIHEWGRQFLNCNVSEITNQIGLIQQGNANLQISLAAYFLNHSILLKDHAIDEICTNLTIGAIKLLTWISDPEAVFRTYRAIGNLITFNSHIVVPIIKSVDQLRSALEQNRSALYEKLAEISLELSEKLL